MHEASPSPPFDKGDINLSKQDAFVGGDVAAEMHGTPHPALRRNFIHANKTTFVDYNAYSVESVLHELFLASPHRTYDPEEVRVDSARARCFRRTACIGKSNTR